MEEENPMISMSRSRKIIRRSIYTFLQHYQFFNSIASIISLPFSISLLISQSHPPLSFLDSIQTRIHFLFQAAGFPPSSGFLTLISLKFSQTISSSILTLPFAISFLLLAKASIIHFLKTHFQKYPSHRSNNNPFSNLFAPLLSTHLWTQVLIFSANTTSICIIFFIFTVLKGAHLYSAKWALLLSSLGAVFYSIVVANALVISNLALVTSGMELSSGFRSILTACGLIRGRTATALALALPTNLCLAAVEALFYCRLVAKSPDHHDDQRQLWILAVEGLLIGYLYSILLVIDVIMGYFFYQSCKSKNELMMMIWPRIDPDDDQGIDDYEEEWNDDQVEKVKGFEEYV